MHVFLIGNVCVCLCGQMTVGDIQRQSPGTDKHGNSIRTCTSLAASDRVWGGQARWCRITLVCTSRAHNSCISPYPHALSPPILPAIASPHTHTLSHLPCHQLLHLPIPRRSLTSHATSYCISPYPHALSPPILPAIASPHTHTLSHLPSHQLLHLPISTVFAPPCTDCNCMFHTHPLLSNLLTTLSPPLTITFAPPCTDFSCVFHFHSSCNSYELLQFP